jgi:Superfamily I DNA and RNA helicases
MLKSSQLTPEQLRLIQAPFQGAIFLEGPAGTGKTTVGLERMAHMLCNGVRGDSILVISAQRSLVEPYLEKLGDLSIQKAIQPTVLTIGGLAQRMVDHYWQEIATQAGFAHPDQIPVFLTQETSRYYMVRVVEPFIESGFFGSVTSNRGRIYGQILDTLNKSAIMGFPLNEIGTRLDLAWMGDDRLSLVGAQVQKCAEEFRRHCLKNNLLDFSLQMEVFVHCLWADPKIRQRIIHNFAHLIVDNCEEDTPVAHDILSQWIADAQSALVIYDTDGGLRTFLGADAESALRLRDCCDLKVQLRQSFVCSPEISTLAQELTNNLSHQFQPVPIVDLTKAIDVPGDDNLYFPEMLDWAAETARHLIQDQGVCPNQIAVLAPFMPNSLLFTLKSRLHELGLEAWTYRPSRPLREEPPARCLQTLVKLSHPHWQMEPDQEDVAQALIEAIEGLDPVRGHMLTRAVYNPGQNGNLLLPLEKLDNPEVLQRVPFIVLERYETLRAWLTAAAAQAEIELDMFISRLFGEVLSQPGYRFHTDAYAGLVTHRLITSISYFREALEIFAPNPNKSIGQEYIEMAEQDIVATQHASGSNPRIDGAILIAPAFSFLMNNTPVEHQIWLNTGDISWWRRIAQPLTHPYVLNRSWSIDRPWKEADEYDTNQRQMLHLALGLLRRCRTQIHLGICEMDELGNESEGPLLRALSNALINQRNLAKKAPVLPGGRN